MKYAKRYEGVHWLYGSLTNDYCKWGWKLYEDDSDEDDYWGKALESSEKPGTVIV